MRTNNKLIVMNWKCNPRSIAEARVLATASDVKGVVVCPPAVFIHSVATKLKKASLGAQNGFWEEGAYTGEYSFGQLKSVGVKYAIIGHSERRLLFGENSQIISKKIASALAANISPIVCVGEKKRTTVSIAVKTVVAELNNSLTGISKENLGKIILAYEPIWAIGTGKNASLAEILPIISAMKKYMIDLSGKRIKIIYGGSVSPENVNSYTVSPFIDGVLIGGASANKQKSAEIIKKLHSLNL